MSIQIVHAFQAPIAHPNGLAAGRPGLWMVDQKTQEVVLVDWTHGKELHRAKTESENSSGLAFDGTRLWVACNGMTGNKAVLKVDPNSGATLARFPIPLDAQSGVHGLEWANGTVWVTSLRVRRLAQVRDGDWTVVHSIPFDHTRAHGLAWEGSTPLTTGGSTSFDFAQPSPRAGPEPSQRAQAEGDKSLTRAAGHLWCVDTNDRAIYKLDAVNGREVEIIKIAVAHPEPHGLTIYEGTLWYCDANTGVVCQIQGG